MNLTEKRRAIAGLLNERSAADAMAVYYAFYHPDEKTELVTYPVGVRPATGYVALSRTGIDLFRPLVTLRLPPEDVDAGVELIYSALTPGAAVILGGPAAYAPLIRALFDVHQEELVRINVLDPNRFEPIINVLVTSAPSGNNLPRSVIRAPDTEDGGGGVVAAAGLNWRSPHFAEISVRTKPRYQRRGWGRSVVSAMVQHLLEQDCIPLYVVAEENEASIQLAEKLGFVDSGARDVLIEGILKPQP